MNILILSWRGPGHPKAGGAELVTLEHAKAWVKNKHQVILFTSLYSGAKSFEVIDRVSVMRRGSEIGVRLAVLLWYFLGKHPKFDLVIDEFHGIPFFTPLFIRAKKMAFIHEVAKEVWFLNYIWPKAILGYLLEPWIIKLLYKHVPFMTVSDSTKTDLINWGVPEKNISVVPNGVTVEHLRSKPKKEKKITVIYLGSLSTDKGIEDAIASFAKLTRRNPSWQYWVVGKGSDVYTKYLRKSCDQAGVKNITFFGFVDEKRKFELLARAHILINPSVREGWGLTVIEAAAMGVPTVGYDVPGLRDSIVNNRTGLLTEINSDALANNIEKLVKDKKRYKYFSNNCLVWSKRFTWKKSTNKSLLLIKRIVKQKYY